MSSKYYHTQENRGEALTEPIPSTKNNTWMGDATYFWYDEQDAMFWGVKSKNRTGKYTIYIADINSSKVLDTVFNEEHYVFWIKQIEKAAKNFVMRTGNKPTLKEINDFFKEKKIWTKFTGILFQDISKNPEHYLVTDFQYKKRIQIAVYDNSIINNFAFHYDGFC